MEARIQSPIQHDTLDMSLRYIGDEVAPLMPESIAPVQFRQPVCDETQVMGETYNERRTLYDEFGSNTTLPTIDLDRVPGARAAQRNCDITSARFLPVEMHHVNILSDEGLCEVLNNFRSEINESPRDVNYHILTCNVDTYERTLKVDVMFVY